MNQLGLTLSCVTLTAVATVVSAQQQVVVPRQHLVPQTQLPEASVTCQVVAEQKKPGPAETKDLGRLKQSKWIVTSVERDGKTVPAQYGQRKGDVIEFKMDDNGLPIFG